jgi:DNA polymerase I
MDFTLVTRSNFESVKTRLEQELFLSLDFETTGLHPYHGDKVFSMAIATSNHSYYFNFHAYESLPEELVLEKSSLLYLSDLFDDPRITWFIHNAKFDMAFLFQEGFTLKGNIHCTYVGARLENNTHRDLSLADCAERIGEAKDDRVEEWIKTNSAFKKVLINERIVKQKDFTQVPFDIMAEYAARDAHVCFRLGTHQLSVFEKWKSSYPTIPATLDVCLNEQKLTKTLFDMEKLGAKLDVKYCNDALGICATETSDSIANFEKHTGKSFKLSPKLFEEVFIGDKDKWQYTEKHNPSFVSDIVKNFSSEAAKEVVRYRMGKTKHDFFTGFLDAKDADGCIHTSFNPGRAVTGRFSSSNPNLQNLKRNDNEDSFDVRKAIIPRDGYLFVMIDFDQMEYRMMLDQANSKSLIREVQNGLDVHEATAKLAGVTRSEAKTVNFLTLYGGGISTLAESLGVSENKARDIQQHIRKAAPEIQTFIRSVIDKAESRGWVFNWYGRRYYFPDKTKCYRAPNYLIQGGCADVIKIAMNKIASFLEDKRSRMVLTIHDELVFEIHKDELDTIATIKHLMETVYPYRKLPLTVSIDHSYTSLGSKIKGLPIELTRGAQESRDSV